MELRHLRYFAAIARHGTFTAAAAELRVAQPALSQQIRQLEGELGVVLFERGRQGAALTEAGRALLARAERILAEAEAARLEAAEFAGLGRGRVAIGTIQSVGVLRLPKLLAAFRKRYPRIDLSLRTENTVQLLDLVERGALDLAMVHFGVVRFAGRGGREVVYPRMERPALDVETLYSEDLVLATALGHPLAKRARAGLRELADEPFIGFKEGSSLRDAVAGAASALGFEPRVAVETSGNDSVRSLVAAGLGVALLPRSVVDGPGPPVALVPLASPKITRTVALARPAGREQPPAVRALEDFLGDSLRQSGKGEKRGKAP
jgi:DNA-binding transcriptional LysR family regulator